MRRDFERIPGVRETAIGRVGTELTFPYPEVQRIIALCSVNEIAVLGVELFQVKLDGYYAIGSSDYDLREKQRWSVVHQSDWPKYVKHNNELATKSVQQNPLGEDHAYVLTTASWREFQEMKKK